MSSTDSFCPKAERNSMGSYYTKKPTIQVPWHFAPWDNLRESEPSWIIRNMWYEGEDGEMLVVEFSCCDCPCGWQGTITRWESSVHARSHFERIAAEIRTDRSMKVGVYLFWKLQKVDHCGKKFSEYTGLPELPDGRW